MTQDPFKDGREEARRVGTDIGFDIGKVVHVPDDAGHRVVIETITDTGETASGQEAAIVVADTRGDISLPEEGDTVAVARFKDRRPIVLGFIYTAETNVPGYTDGDRKLDGDPLILSGSSVDLETNLDASGYQLQTVNILDFEDRSGTGKHYELTNLSGELKFNVFDSSNNFQRTALKMKEGGNVVKDDGTNLVVRGGSDIEVWPGEVSLIVLKGTGVSIFGDTSANYGSLRDHGTDAGDCLRWYNSSKDVVIPNGNLSVKSPGYIENQQGFWSSRLNTSQGNAEDGIYVNIFETVFKNSGFTKVSASEIEIDKTGTYRISFKVNFHRTGSDSTSGRNIMFAELEHNGTRLTPHTRGVCYIRTDAMGDEGDATTDIIKDLTAGDRIRIFAGEERGGETGNNIERATINLEYLG